MSTKDLEKTTNSLESSNMKENFSLFLIWLLIFTILFAKLIYFPDAASVFIYGNI